MSMSVGSMTFPDWGAATSAIARRSFDATISALDAETSSLDAEMSALDAEMSALGAETSALGTAMFAIARSYWRYRRGVSGDIGDCGVGITPQMCNRVTNHGDMSTFSKPATGNLYVKPTTVVRVPGWSSWMDIENRGGYLLYSLIFRYSQRIFNNFQRK